jgi:hypothetical protein
MAATDRSCTTPSKAIAAALEDMVAEAPEQWYTFKPMWPARASESAALEARASGSSTAPGGGSGT